MNSKLKKTRSKKGRAPGAVPPLTKLECADEDELMSVPTVDNDVAAWWAELDAEVRADGNPATMDEIGAIDAMPEIDVSTAVSKLAETLPAPSHSDKSNVLLFRRNHDEHRASEATSNTPSQMTRLACDSGIAINDRFPEAIWQQEFPELFHSSLIELSCTSRLDNMLVALVALRQDARLKPLASALELAQEIAYAEFRPEIRCLTLSGPGNDRYSAQWSYLGDWFRDHYYRCRYTASKVLASLHEVLKQEDRAKRNWTYRQLRGTIVFTVIGAEQAVGQCENGREWQSRLHERMTRDQYSDCLHQTNLMMTVIEGGNVMSVVPHSVDDAVRSATIVYQSDAPPASEILASYLPMIKSVLDGEETVFHE